MPSQVEFAIVFDVDGVLLHDYHPIKGAQKAMQLVHNYKIPYIFLSNGGGRVEEIQAMNYSKALETEIPVERVIVSHTPMKDLVPKYKNQRVLIFGLEKDHTMQLAKKYGFERAEFWRDFQDTHKYLVPTQCPDDVVVTDTSNEEPVKALLVFSCPRDWEASLQIAYDLLVSDGRVGFNSDKQVVEIYFSNPDVVYAGKAKDPRFTQGAFRECLEHLFYHCTGRKLRVNLYGKPNKVTYDYAKKVLNNMSDKIKTVYAIGDNPLSDIKGANAAGKEWFSILVKTGCFKGEGNDEKNPAKMCVSDVLEAIQFIIKREKLA